MVPACCGHFAWEAALKTKAGRVPSAAAVSSVPLEDVGVGTQTQLRTRASPGRENPSSAGKFRGWAEEQGRLQAKAEKGLNVP